jgi:AraC family transcriptional regulator
MLIQSIRRHTTQFSTRDMPRTARPRRSRVRGLDKRQLELVSGTIEEKIGEPITVSMLSAAAGLSRSHFSHAFRNSVGRTPHDYVMSLRVDRAMKLMVDAQASLSQIALDTGFCDQAHFAKTFRRAVGATPTEWRRAQPSFLGAEHLHYCVD